MSTVRQNLRAARKLIENPENWHKGSWARLLGTEQGSYDMACLCMAGALCVSKADPDSINPRFSGFGWATIRAERRALEEAIAALHPQRGSARVHEFNDDPHTTHEMMLAVFDYAIKAHPLTAYDVLIEAADYIEQHGWTRRAFWDEDGTCVCTVGGMMVAVAGGLLSAFNARISKMLATPVIAEACRVLIETVDHADHPGVRGVELRVFRWNGHPERTKEEVVASLRAAAESIKP